MERVYQPPMKYVVLDESGQVTAMTATRWTAERLIEGIRAHDSPTSRLGSWSIEPNGAADEIGRQQADIDKLLAERQGWADEIERLRAEIEKCGDSAHRASQQKEPSDGT